MFLRIPTGEANPNYLQPTKCSDPPKYEDISGRLSHHNIKSIHIIHGYFYFCYEMILKSTNMDTLRQFNLGNFPANHFGLPGASPAAMLQGVRSGHQRHGLRGEAGFFGAESHGIPLEKICGYPLVI